MSACALRTFHNRSLRECTIVLSKLHILVTDHAKILIPGGCRSRKLLPHFVKQPCSTLILVQRKGLDHAKESFPPGHHDDAASKFDGYVFVGDPPEHIACRDA